MINALHVPWVVPMAGSLGAVTDSDPEWYDDDHDVSGLLEED